MYALGFSYVNQFPGCLDFGIACMYLRYIYLVAILLRSSYQMHLKLVRSLCLHRWYNSRSTFCLPKTAVIFYSIYGFLSVKYAYCDRSF